MVALDLLEQLLQFDPARRVNVEKALEHRWLEVYHEPEEEISHPKHFDFSFESISAIEDLKAVIANEVREYKISHPLPVRTGQLQVEVEMAEVTASPEVNNDQINDLDEELRMKGII